MTSNHNRRWHVTLQFEHQQRVHLQQQLEQLAKQHSMLEHAAMIRHSETDCERSVVRGESTHGLLSRSMPPVRQSPCVYASVFACLPVECDS